MYADHLLKALEMMTSTRQNLVLECKSCRYFFSLLGFNFAPFFAACDGLGYSV